MIHIYIYTYVRQRLTIATIYTSIPGEGLLYKIVVQLLRERFV